MNKLILWQIVNKNCRVNHNYSYETLSETHQIRILHDRFFDKPVITLPFLHFSKLTNLRFEAEHEQYINLVYYLEEHEVEDLQEHPFVREQFYRSFISHINHCVSLHEVRTDFAYIPKKVNLESFISPINVYCSKIVYEWFDNFPFHLPVEWVELASGFITPLEKPEQYHLQDVLAELPEIQLRSGYIDHPFVKAEENKRICLVVPDELYHVYKMQPNTITRQKRIKNTESSCIWLYSEKEWHLNWYSFREEHEKKTNCMAWHMIHYDDKPDLASTFEWDEFYWIGNQPLTLKNLGFTMPYPKAKRTVFIPLNHHSWSVIIGTCMPRILGYLLWKHKMGSPTLHSMCLFNLLPGYWEALSERCSFENALPPVITNDVSIVRDDRVVRMDDWDRYLYHLLEDRGDHFEQKKLQWGLSNYHYPQWTLQTSDICHHGVQETCPVTYESSLTKSMIQWNCGHFIEVEAHWKWLATKALSNHPATCPMCRFHVNSGLPCWRLLRNAEDNFYFTMKPFGGHVHDLLEWMKINGSESYGIILPRQPFGSSLWNQLQKWVKCWVSSGKRRNYQSRNGVLMPLSTNLPPNRPVNYPDIDLFENIQVIKQISKNGSISMNPKVDKWVYIWENNLDMKPFESWLATKKDRQIYVCEDSSMNVKILKSI